MSVAMLSRIKIYASDIIIKYLCDCIKEISIDDHIFFPRLVLKKYYKFDKVYQSLIYIY